MTKLHGLAGEPKDVDMAGMDPDTIGGERPAGDEDEDGGEPATEEEQALYDRFAEEAHGILYPNGEVSPQIVADLRGDIDPKVMEMFANTQPPVSGSPQDMVAAEAVLLTILIDEKLGYGAMAAGARQSGEEGLDFDSVVLHSGKAILEQLVEVSESAGIHTFSEQDVEGVWYRAIDLYGTVSQTIGKTGYDKAALEAEFAGIVEADKAGRLKDILPGLPGGAPMKRED